MHLHIVSFNVPLPADYGGVIDVFYRLRALWQEGVRIHLHCYTYGRKPVEELEQYCDSVQYYRRATLPHNLFTREPYIVSSRYNKHLLKNLSADDYPVLLEGLHCCALLPILRQANPNRLLLVRAHNVEHQYYSLLSQSERRWWYRLYLEHEARKLKRYEEVLHQASHILAISAADAEYFRHRSYAPVTLIPAGHGKEQVTAAEGKGEYMLFQGDLSVADNRRAVEYLLHEVFPPEQGLPPLPLVVAGRNPSAQLSQQIEEYNNRVGAVEAVRLVANPDETAMAALLSQAHIHILFTNQATGVKLKLLTALYAGRFCLVNDLMVEGTGLAPLCHCANTPQEVREKVEELMRQSFTQAMLEVRKTLLSAGFDDRQGARKVVDIIRNAIGCM